MTLLPTPLRRSNADTMDDGIFIPRDFIDSVQDWDGRLKQLRDGNEWLERIDKKLSASDLSILRHAFLTDGHSFMNILSQYLNAVMWQEFVAYTCTQAVSGVPVLMHMLRMAWYGSRAIKCAPGSLSKALKDALDNLNGSQLFGSGCVEAIRRRYCSVGPILSPFINFSTLKDLVEGKCKEWELAEIGHLNQMYETAKEQHRFFNLKTETSTDTDVLIAEVANMIRLINSTLPDDMTFGHDVPSHAGEPEFLLDSNRWSTIGENLRCLGLGVGADVPRSFNQPKPKTIIMALKAVINNEGPAINIMLSRLESYQLQIQQQQQVITALQFRHLMEHLPIGVRDQWLAAASSDTDEVSKASRWDRMKEVEKWNEFWLESVKQIFRSYMKNGAEAWEGSKGHEPSPFSDLLKHHLIRAGEKNNERDAVHLLAHETDVGERVKRLYSTLSQIIHQYSDANFEVNRLNFSPLDARILSALIPKNIKKKVSDDEDNRVPMDEKSEIMAWKKEFRRYVWENITPPPSTQNQARPSERSILDNVKGLGAFLRSKFPTAELLPKDLSITQAFFDDAKCISAITAKFTLAKKHINSCGMIHNTVLAAVFDAIGRMSLLAAGRCVVNGSVKLTVETNFVATAGDQVHVASTMKQDPNEGFRTVVDMETSKNGMIADGSFCAWEVRETEDGEAYDNMI